MKINKLEKNVLIYRFFSYPPNRETYHSLYKNHTFSGKMNGRVYISFVRPSAYVIKYAFDVFQQSPSRQTYFAHEAGKCKYIQRFAVYQILFVSSVTHMCYELIRICLFIAVATRP